MCRKYHASAQNKSKLIRCFILFWQSEVNDIKYLLFWQIKSSYKMKILKFLRITAHQFEHLNIRSGFMKIMIRTSSSLMKYILNSSYPLFFYNQYISCYLIKYTYILSWWNLVDTLTKDDNITYDFNIILRVRYTHFFNLRDTSENFFHIVFIYMHKFSIWYRHCKDMMMSICNTDLPLINSENN